MKDPLGIGNDSPAESTEVKLIRDLRELRAIADELDLKQKKLAKKKKPEKGKNRGDG